jgi:lysine 2,3-aminomutase
MMVMEKKNQQLPEEEIEPLGWDDWHWQIKNRITDVEHLKKVINISPEEESSIRECLKKFRMAITPYYASLIDQNDPECPIRKQAIPDKRELYISPSDMADPLNECNSELPNLVHRYPDRVLFIVTRTCSMYCRHCTRRRIVGEEDYEISSEMIDKSILYIRNSPQIRDVLISGGDPLVLSDDKLERIIRQLRTIPHVEIIRIGTRVPVVMPMRITDELVAMLRKYHPIWINTHFNHPRELTDAARAACEKIVDAGIPLSVDSG